MTAEYRDRQFALMLQRLDFFEQGKITLAGLVADLEGLIAALGTAGIAESQIHRSWTILEEVLAVMLDENRGPDADDERLVRQAVDEVRKLAAEAIDQK